jgi:hypothetical protein
MWGSEHSSIVDNQIAVLQDAMDALLSILTVLDIIGEVVGDPGEVLKDYPKNHSRTFPLLLHFHQEVCT